MAVQPDFNSDFMDGAMVSNPAHHPGPYCSLLLYTDRTSLHGKANSGVKCKSGLLPHGKSATAGFKSQSVFLSY